MRFWVVCMFLAAGCSQVFGLDTPTRTLDATVGDGSELDADTDSARDSPSADAPRSLLEVLVDLDLVTNALVVLDAGDAASFDGTSQTWSNLVAGTNFSRGGNTGAQGDDPTFHGVAGARSPEEYFLFDGDDLFRETMAGWGDDALHHDGAKLTFVAIDWPVDSGLAFNLFSNCRCADSGVNSPGTVFFRNNTTHVQVYGQEGDTNMLLLTSTAGTVAAGAWAFMAVSVDANTKSDVTHRFGQTVETYLDEAHFYGGGNADRPATIGAMGNGVNPAPNGSRIAMFAVWNRALTAVELAALYGAIKAARFPSLP